ncbi:MAG TPA: hypothetical protein VMX36_15240 [Sedimentisphaerales bacterium]|nr:hypothetical protein [Sedimentisphaerales bacterium]
MKTTSLFIEIMILGGETLAWCVMLVVCIGGLSPEKAAEVLSSPFVWGSALPFCYVLGIVVDSRIHEWFFRSKQKRIRATVIRKRQQSKELNDDECKVYWREVRKASMGMPLAGTTVLAYIRHRIRIMRGSVGNIPLIAVFGAVLLIKSGCGLVYAALVLLVGAGLTYACYRVWERIERSWSTLSYDWYELRNSQQQ